jgi:putative tricarboxylic transport membrane protein
MVECPPSVLIPMILVLSVVGTYAIQNSVVDVYFMLGFGIFGYLLKMYGFQVGPVVLGMILGPMMDVSWRRAVISVGDDLGFFLEEMFTSPLSLVLIGFMSFLLLSQTPLAGWLRRRRDQPPG